VIEQHPQGSGYEGATVAGAVLATVFFPLFALIAALFLIGGQPDPYKRKQLRTWAWASGCWMLLGVLLFVLAFVSIGTGSGAPSPLP
jgi:hypothetical protein